MDSHCHATHYGFQVKKCNKSDCTFCSVLHRNRLEDEMFDTLKFLPEPILDQSKHKNFDELYGTVTSEKDHPSLKYGLKANEANKKNKELLVAQ